MCWRELSLRRRHAVFPIRCRRGISASAHQVRFRFRCGSRRRYTARTPARKPGSPLRADTIPIFTTRSTACSISPPKEAVISRKLRNSIIISFFEIIPLLHTFKNQNSRRVVSARLLMDSFEYPSHKAPRKVPDARPRPHGSPLIANSVLAAAPSCRLLFQGSDLIAGLHASGQNLYQLVVDPVNFSA